MAIVDEAFRAEVRAASGGDGEAILRDDADDTASQLSPELDVADAVLATLRRGQVREIDSWLAGSIRPLLAMVTAASLLAIAVGFFAQQALADLQDPVGALFSPW